VRILLSVVAFLCAIALLGCFEWTEDSQGHLTSVGLPGAPVWQSDPNAAQAQPVTPTEMGFTQEEASRMSGPVLVIPAAPPSRAWRYRFYQTGQNHCQTDLAKMLQERAGNGDAGPAPYCTDHPTAPPTKGNALIF
jgi:hypothetical protein